MAPGFRPVIPHTFCSAVALPSCLGSPFRPLRAVRRPLDREADEARQEDVIARIRQIVEAAGGQLEAADALGRQRLAYEILKRSEAFRWVVTLTAPAAAVEEVDR